MDEGKMKKITLSNGSTMNGSIIDFCQKCGVGVFGEKMFNAIVENMEKANDNGDLCHSRSVSESQENIEPIQGFEGFKL